MKVSRFTVTLTRRELERVLNIDGVTGVSVICEAYKESDYSMDGEAPKKIDYGKVTVLPVDGKGICNLHESFYIAQPEVKFDVEE